MPEHFQTIKRSWEFYKTASGRSPVKDYLDTLSKTDKAAVGAKMRLVQTGASNGKHLRDAIFEVKVALGNKQYRVLYATVGERGATLLALEAFTKKTQKTPPATITLAETRLRDWLSRANP